MSTHMLAARTDIRRQSSSVLLEIAIAIRTHIAFTDNCKLE